MNFVKNRLIKFVEERRKNISEEILLKMTFVKAPRHIYFNEYCFNKKNCKREEIKLKE